MLLGGGGVGEGVAESGGGRGLHLLAGAALVVEDLPSTPETLDWVFVSPAAQFGSFAPGERLGRYRVGDDVAVDPAGGAISGADYALGLVDLVDGESAR